MEVDTRVTVWAGVGEERKQILHEVVFPIAQVRSVLMVR